MSVVSMAGAVAMAMLVPEVELSAVYEGFSAPGWIMVVGMCVVSAALFETGVADRIGNAIGNSWWAKSERRFVVAASACCTIMSAFMSNNGTVAIWMPLIAVVAAASAGKIRSKIVIFAAGTGAIIGGGTTLIGSTSQLAANSVLQGYKGYEAGLGVFDMTKIMLPVCIVQIIFWGTIGYWLLKKVLKPEDPHFNDGNMYAEELFADQGADKYADVPKWKGNVALGTMLLCIVLFVIQGFKPFSNFLNIGLVGMIGAVIVIGTGCISVKKAYADLPWDVFIVIGTVSTLGTGLDVTGGGKMIADFDSSYRSAVQCSDQCDVQQCYGSYALPDLYSDGYCSGNQPDSMGNPDCGYIQLCDCDFLWNSGKHSDSAGRLQIHGFCKDRRTIVDYLYYRRCNYCKYDFILT